jgi:ribosomal protein S27AE
MHEVSWLCKRCNYIEYELLRKMKMCTECIELEVLLAH